MRTRFTLILAGTILLVAAMLGYMIVKAKWWHERGWAGVVYVAGDQGARQGKLLGLREGAVMMTVAGGPAEGRLLYRDEILAINGIPRTDANRLRALDAGVKRGSVLTYHIKRGNRVMDVPVRVTSPLRARMVIIYHVVALLVGGVFLTIALLIVARAPDDSRALVFHVLAVISSLALLAQAASVYEERQARGIIYGGTGLAPYVVVGVMLAFLYPPLILHLALIFPRKRPIVERHPVVLRWVYAVTLLSLLFMAMSAWLAVLASGSDPTGSRTRIRHAIDSGSWVYTAISVAIALWILFAARREGIRAAIARRPFSASIAALGLIFGLADALGHYVPKYVTGILGGSVVVLPILLLLSFPILACVALYRSYKSSNVEEKRQVAWPLWGLLITVAGKIICAVVVFGTLAWLALTRQDIMRWRGFFEVFQTLPTLLTLAIPISFAVAILKYRLMNIDIIIRKTVVYAILSGAIILMYLALVGGLGTLLVSVAGVRNQTMVIVSTLVVALLFVPLRNKLQLLVDRNLFRHKYDYPEALKAISAESRIATDGIQLLPTVAEKLQQALQNRALVIFAERQDDYVAVAKVGVPDALLGRLRVPRAFASQLDRPFDPRRRQLSEEAASALARVEAVLIVPVGTRAFIAAARKLSGGDFDVEDIDFLRAMADEVSLAMDRIRMQADESDFDQARSIQQALLPQDVPRVEKLDVSGVWHPARSMGGDYYDLIPLSDTELAVCIGDVAGKGMPAALLMSGLQAAVRASASSSPRDLCERVRRVVVSSLSGGRFVTFFYATLDTAAMRLRWTNAGHNAPILARADGSIVRLAEGGPALSRLFRETKYEESEIALRPGDRFVLFTDGVSEARDAAGEMFGEERIEEIAARASGIGATELQKMIVDAATGHAGGELEDDLTLVVVRVAE